MLLHKLKILGPLIFVIFVDAIGYALVYPLIPSLFDIPPTGVFDFNRTVYSVDFFMGLAFWIYPLCMFLSASGLGYFSDRYGRKGILLFSTAMMMIGMLLMGLSCTYISLWLFFIGRAICGFFAGLLSVAQAAVSDVSLPEEKPFHMNLVTIVMGLGIILGPIIGGVFADKLLFKGFNFSLAFYISAGLQFLALLWLGLSYHESLKPYDRQQSSSFFGRIKQTIKQPRWRKLALALFFMQLSFTLYVQMMLIELSFHFNDSTVGIGTFYAFMGLCFFFGFFVVVRILMKKLKLENITIVALFLMGIIQIFSSLDSHQAVLWILSVPIVILNVISFTSLMTTFSNSGLEEKQGSAMGFYNSIMACSLVVSGLATNLLPYMSSHFLILIAGIMGLLGAFIMLFRQRPRTSV